MKQSSSEQEMRELEQLEDFNELEGLEETRLASREIFDGKILHVFEDTVRLPDGGEAIGIRKDEAFIGAFQLLPDDEPDAGCLGWYWLDPAWRGKGLGIAPMGQVLSHFRRQGVSLLRLSCGDRDLRRFFARLGFYPLSGDVMEKDIRQQLPPIPQAYRP